VRTLLVARDGDDVVGVAEFGGSLQDNLHLADLAPMGPSGATRSSSCRTARTTSSRTTRW
jgi:hypothetical protein